MDKTVILAVAGSGKTYHLVEKLDEKKRFLIITYTTGNTENLRIAIINKFGFIPNNIKIKSFFTFLYSFCFKPFLASALKSKGIFWDFPPDFTRTLKRDNNNHYLLKNKWLYHNRISKLLEEKEVLNDINERLEKYYDCLYIDEIQDFGGHDFNLLKEISKSNIELLFVGDFFQHTFSTSNDGAVNKTLHNNPVAYLQQYEAMNLKIDSATLVQSRRCSKSVCDFLREKLAIEIYSKFQNETVIRFINDEQEAEDVYYNNNIIKLFYQQNHLFDCYSDNWGNCKGLEFENVCVVLNDSTLLSYTKGKLKDMAPTTKNKFYVACTRTTNNLYFVPQKMFNSKKKA